MTLSDREKFASLVTQKIEDLDLKDLESFESTTDGISPIMDLGDGEELEDVELDPLQEDLFSD